MSAFNVQEFAVNLHDALAILAVVALIGAVLMLSLIHISEPTRPY